MFCQNCGAQLPEGSAFCNVCGVKIDSAEDSVNYKQTNYDFFGQPVDENTETTKKPKVLWLIVSGVALLTIAIVLILLLTGGNDKDLLGKWSVTKEDGYEKTIYSYEFFDNGICEGKIFYKSENWGGDTDTYSPSPSKFEYETDGNTLTLTTHGSSGSTGTYKIIITLKYIIHENELTLTPVKAEIFKNGELEESTTDFDEDDVLVLTKQY